MFDFPSTSWLCTILSWPITFKPVVFIITECGNAQEGDNCLQGSTHWPNSHVYPLEEAGIPGKNPHINEENMQTSCRKHPGRDLVAAKERCYQLNQLAVQLQVWKLKQTWEQTQISVKLLVCSENWTFNQNKYLDYYYYFFLTISVKSVSALKSFFFLFFIIIDSKKIIDVADKGKQNIDMRQI